jgi:cytochrome c biogenesis protein CcmG/thiol:disulfide interchange protein DsbE
MKTGVTILAGLLAGVLVAAGILAAFIFVGPDPVGLRPTPTPTLVPTVAPSPSASVAPAPSTACGSPVPSAAPAAAGSAGPGCGPGASGSPAASLDPGAAFDIGQPAPSLSVPQLAAGAGGRIDLAALKGKAVWLNFMQTSCPECIDEFPVMNGFAARYENDGLVVIAVDIRENDDIVRAFVQQLNATFPVGLDPDGTAQKVWGVYALPIHFFIDKDGIIRAGALGGVGADAFAKDLETILPGVKVTP